MVQTQKAVANSALYLPFETFVDKYILFGRRPMLAVWMVIAYLVCIFGMLYSLKYDYRRWEQQYLIPITIGIAAIFGNIFFILRSSDLIRDRLPKVILLLSNSDERLGSTHDLSRIYRGRRLLAWMLIITLLGECTFFWLGLNMPTMRTRALATIAIAIIFALLGITVALAVGFWSWMNRFGRRLPTIDVFHPDKMGGLRPLADPSDWVISMGAVLAALYSAGAHYSPYSHLEWRMYSYAWVVFATILLVLAFIVPAYSIHRCLTNAKGSVAAKLSQQNNRVFGSFENNKLTNTADIVALMWFTEALNKLNVWPYTQLAARVASTAALQFVPLILRTFLSHP